MSLKSRSAQVLTAALMRDASLSAEPDQVETIVKNILMDLEEAGLSIKTARDSWLPPHRPCLVYVDSNADLVYTLDDSAWTANDLPGRDRAFCQRLLEQALARFRPLTAPATEQVAEHLQFLLRACYGVDVQLAGAGRSAEPDASEIDRLAAYLLEHFDGEIGEGSAVDNAIRLLNSALLRRDAAKMRAELDFTLKSRQRDRDEDDG